MSTPPDPRPDHPSDLSELARHEARIVLPPPKSGGKPVTPALIDWIYKHGGKHAPEVAAGVLERHAFGVRKYKKGLETDDGRATHAETWQELLDALQYGQKAEMMGEDLATPLMVETLRLLRLKIEPEAARMTSIFDITRTILLVGVSLAVGLIIGLGLGRA